VKVNEPNLSTQVIPDPLDTGKDSDIPQDQSRVESLRITQSFVEETKNATLGNGRSDPAATKRLRHLDDEIVDLSDPDIRLSLDLYMSCVNEPEPKATYNSVCKATIRRFPQVEVLSYQRAKKIIADSLHY